MAQYFCDLSRDGAAILAEFAAVSGSTALSMVADGGSPALRSIKTAAAVALYEWSPAGISEQVEVLVRARGTTTGANMRIGAAGRIANRGDTVDGWVVGDFSSMSLQMGEASNYGRWSQSNIGVSNTAYTWRRLRVVGDTIHGKMWPDGTDEPADWTRVESRDSLPGAGGAGLFFFGAATSFVNFLSVGTDGDSAASTPTGNEVTPVAADVSLNWDIRERVAAELSLLWPIHGAVVVDASLRWSVLQSVGADASLRWDIRERVIAEADIRWQLLQSIQSDASLAWATHEQILAALDLRWSTESALSRVIADLSLRWSVIDRIASSLALSWDVRETVGADAEIRWSVLRQVAQDLTARWDVLQRIERGETLRWEVRARTASDLTLRWRIESNNSFPDLAGTITISTATPRISLASATPVITIH